KVGGLLAFADSNIGEDCNQHNDDESWNVDEDTFAEQHGGAIPCVLDKHQTLTEWSSGSKRFFNLSVCQLRGSRIGCQPCRKVNSKTFKEVVEISAPGDRHHYVANRIFKDQGPADDPGNYFAKGNIGIRVSAAGYRYTAGKFGITKGGESARNSSD